MPAKIPSPGIQGIGPQKFNPKTCLFTVSQQGTLALSGGTTSRQGSR